MSSEEVVLLSHRQIDEHQDVSPNPTTCTFKLEDWNLVVKDAAPPLTPLSTTTAPLVANIPPPPSCVDPVTPIPSRENGDFLVDHLQTPLSLPSPPSQSPQLVDPTPCTPEAAIFNPFAPGHSNLAFTPLCKKHMLQSRSSIARRLNFGSSVLLMDDKNTAIHQQALPFPDDDDDDILLETVYGTLLEAIILDQTEKFLADNLPLESACEGFKTPASAPRLTAIADTCPAPHIKSTQKVRIRTIPPRLCRKLEF